MPELHATRLFKITTERMKNNFFIKMILV